MKRWQLGLGAVALLVLGVSVAAVAATSSGGTESSSGLHSAGTLPRPPAPDIEVADLQAGSVPFAQPLRISVTHGTLSTVEVTDDGGSLVQGASGTDGASWHSFTSLIPLASYSIKVSVTDTEHKITSQTMTVRATDTDKHLSATISPGDGDVVGVGMPIGVTFNHPIPKDQQVEIERRLTITTEPAVTGAWHWMSPSEVHWRPATFWATGTKVTAEINIIRLDIGQGIWGVDQHKAAFTIGDSHISTADISAHTMTITKNGAVIKTVPISAGRDKYPTKGGIHIALEKAQTVTMDSQTVGIPRDSPDGYFEKVLWDVRISNGGAFVHAAPWSVSDQGHRNVSHGCINLSTADAQWFFSFAQRGDIVNIVNSGAPPQLSDAGMADWNIPWPAWQAADPINAAQ